jgi:hypothetical protein
MQVVEDHGAMQCQRMQEYQQMKLGAGELEEALRYEPACHLGVFDDVGG